MALTNYILVSTLIWGAGNGAGYPITTDTVVIKNISKETCEALKRDRELIANKSKGTNWGDTPKAFVAASNHSCTEEK